MTADLATKFHNKRLRVESLPAMPATLDEINRLMSFPQVTTKQIARAISCDQAMTSKVLRIVNSPFYGFPGRISSMLHALTLLGINVIRRLVVSAAVFETINAGMAGLWDHSLGCSLVCAEIARITGRKTPEDFAIAGLLHDIGKAVCSLQLPGARMEIDTLVEKEDISFYEAEKIILGFSHTRVNKWLCEQWNLPLVICEGMVYHHNPMRASSYRDVAAVVQIGDMFTRIFDCGFGGDTGVNAIDPRCLKLLGLDQKKMVEIFDSVEREIAPALAQLKE
jgi:HD-like signal output (HDOD) protein